MEWANEILANISTTQPLGISLLNVTFTDGVIPVSPPLANDFLRMIVTKCSDSMIALELWDIHYEHFNAMSEFRPDVHAPLFPYLQSISISKSPIDYPLLRKFSHVMHLRIYDPFMMHFPPKAFKENEYIDFSRLKSVVVNLAHSDARYGQQILPIIANALDTIEYYYKYREEPGTNDAFVVIAVTSQLRVLKIYGGRRVFRAYQLTKLGSKSTIEELVVPLESHETQRNAQEVICDYPNLNYFEFIIENVKRKKQRQFSTRRFLSKHKNTKRIRCTRNQFRKRRYFEAKYIDIPGTYLRYTGRLIITT